MRRRGREIILDNLTRWATDSAFTSDPQRKADGVWLVEKGKYGSTSGILVCNRSEHAVPELRLDPGVRGWHEVQVRLYHGMQRDGHGVYIGTTKDRALRLLRPEVATEEFETLSLGPREMTGAAVRIDGSYLNCWLDSVRLIPCRAPAPLPPAEKELYAILDFADAPDDYRPMEHCAAECVRVHAEAGFTTIVWKSFAVRCEYHTRVGEMRSAKFQPETRVNVGTLLEKYDTLSAAVTEAKECGVKLLGWIRINNEVSIKPGSEWDKFTPTTPFHLAHPEMRKRYKTGELGPRLSFAFPEVREYLCAIGREILDHGVDGLVIDVLRHPPMVQYDKPLVDEFIAKTGADPMKMDGDGTEEWLRFRAKAFTQLLRDFRSMMDAAGHREKPLCVRIMPQPWRNLRDGCDVEEWLNAELVHTLILGHHCISGPGHPLRWDLNPMMELIRGRARVIAQVFRFTDFAVALELARQAYKQGADGVAIYESNQVVTMPTQRDAVKFLRKAKPALQL